MTRFIIIGASGLIGGHLYQELAARGRQVVGTCYSRTSPDLLRFDMTAQSVLDLVPDLGGEDIVFLLGAKVDQNWVLRHPRESNELNVVATRCCMNAVLERRARLFFLSSESVFDGTKDGYEEANTPNPLTLYAEQKVEVENHLLAQPGDWCLIRTGWNEGAGDDDRGVIADTHGALMGSGARMASDNVFTVTAASDTVEAMIELVDQEKNGVYHLAANPPLRRTEIADLIINTSRFGERMSYQPIAFSNLEFSEPRPARAWLRNDKAVGELGVRFKPPAGVIEKKVAKLDVVFEMSQETTS